MGGSRTVEGSVVDFESGQPITGDATISTSGLTGAVNLTITAQGAAFTITGVPENSAFQVLASAPSHRPTFSEAVIVGETDLRDVKVAAVSDGFVTALATAFGVNPRPERGILLARVVDDRGQPKAGVPKTSLKLDASVTGPFILGDTRQPLPNATATSNSGWVVWFEVTPGVAQLVATAGATVTLDMPISPVNGNTVTLAQIKTVDGAPKLPTNVSFSTQIVPIFGRLSEGGRGCAACHSGNGIGKDLGGLTLDGGAPKIYKELREEDPARVQLLMAEKSQLLTYPSREDPPDRHPNVTFTGPLDPDYLKILVWIKEGAKEN
ncbi:MAG TPA: hypothetical protein VNO30_49435 [Kofleriaceae bacterium]|nr:hypothetical protein [Kofleriaceae bacterium]